MDADPALPAESGPYGNGGEEPDRVMIDARIAQQQDDRRRAAREPVEVDARLRELGTEGTEATVLNISVTGFMAETREELEFTVGARVWLILPGWERANAVVRWAEGKRIGAEFAEPFDLEGLLAAKT